MKKRTFIKENNNLFDIWTSDPTLQNCMDQLIQQNIGSKDDTGYHIPQTAISVTTTSSAAPVKEKKLSKKHSKKSKKRKKGRPHASSGFLTEPQMPLSDLFSFSLPEEQAAAPTKQKSTHKQSAFQPEISLLDLLTTIDLNPEPSDSTSDPTIDSPESSTPSPAETLHLVQRKNYRMKHASIQAVSERQSIQDNIHALKLVITLEEENREATEEELDAIAAFHGWGPCAKLFDNSQANYSTQFDELSHLLNDDELEQATRSITDSYYTPEFAIQGIYAFLEQSGFKEGLILEPSLGSGRFIGFLPDSMNQSHFHGIELDPSTCKIARTLYPNEKIENIGFEKVHNPGLYDIAIGNIPFGQFKVHDARYDKLNLKIHNYFLCKAVDQIRPGGLMAFITSSTTMDSINDKHRQYLNDKAIFLGAVRLPNSAFKEARTSVLTDILFFQKKDGTMSNTIPWLESKETYYEHTDYANTSRYQFISNHDHYKVHVNEYFMDHPDMILGTVSFKTNPYNKFEMHVTSDSSLDLESELLRRIAKIQAVYTPEHKALEQVKGTYIPANPDFKNYSFGIHTDTGVYYRQNSEMRLIDGKNVGRIRSMIEIRDTLLDLLNLQKQETTSDTKDEYRKRLNDKYDAFVARYGRINKKANETAFRDDQSYYLLCALEEYTDQGKFKRKADVFFKDTIKPQTHEDSAESCLDALHRTLCEIGHVDLPYLQSILRTPKSMDSILEELKDEIYFDPAESNPMYHWKPANEYLSGNVKKKLKEAQYAANQNPSLQKNVQALLTVQPEKIMISDIEFQLGSTWIPVNVYNEFMYATLQNGNRYHKPKIVFNEESRTYSIHDKSKSDHFTALLTSTYGIPEYNAEKLLEQTLNLRFPVIKISVPDADHSSKQVEDKEKTMELREKQDRLQAEFRQFCRSRPDINATICDAYNDQFNVIAPCTFNGDHLTLPGMNKNITLRKHQKDGIERILRSSTNTLLDWKVGAGKTYTMIAASQEARRLGLCTKPMFVVPKSLVKQWANDFTTLYPGARVLIPHIKKSMTAKERKIMLSKIVTGNYDAIIISNIQFSYIPMSNDTIQIYAQRALDEFMEIYNSAPEHVNMKKLMSQKKTLEAQLSKLQDSKNDETLTFEELGIDMLFVDESHYFKNLFTPTKLNGVRGVSGASAKKTTDFLMKCDYLNDTYKKGIVFASGTPVSNSVTELFTVLKYLHPKRLNELKLNNFDDFASAFGRVNETYEEDTMGSNFKKVKRFTQFHNLPELMHLFMEVADIKTSEELNLKEPEPRHVEVVLPASKEQLEYIQTLDAQINSKSTKECIFKFLNQALLLSLEQKLINPDYPDNPDSKIHAACRNIYKIWSDTKDKRMTQLVFCDRSTPKPELNVYDMMKNELISMGIPANEIQFIHEADSSSSEKTAKKKEQICENTRLGKTRILFGSTEKLGTGTNVQDRLYAIHHIDIPYRPSDIEQKNGRAIRQGNTNDQVWIYQYITTGTFDHYIANMLQNKQRFIGQILAGKSSSRTCEDNDQMMITFAEWKAVSTGNPLIKDKVRLENDIYKLQILYRAFESNQSVIINRLKNFLPQQISRSTRRINGLEENIQLSSLHPFTDNFFEMTVEGVTYNKPKDAGNALLAALRNIPKDRMYENAAVFHGLPIALEYDQYAHIYYAWIGKTIRSKCTLGSSDTGNITRIGNVIKDLSKELTEEKGRLNTYLLDKKESERELAKPFEKEQELQDAVQALRLVNAQLNIDNEN